MCESYASLNLLRKSYVRLKIVAEFHHKSHGIPISEDDSYVETDGEQIWDSTTRNKFTKYVRMV